MAVKIVTFTLDGMIKMIIGNHSARNYIMLHEGFYINEKLPFVFLREKGCITVKCLKMVIYNLS